MEQNLKPVRLKLKWSLVSLMVLFKSSYLSSLCKAFHLETRPASTATKSLALKSRKEAAAPNKRGASGRG